MKTHVLFGAVLVVTGCKTDTIDLEEKINGLSQKVAALEQHLASLQVTAVENASELERAAGTIAAATAFFAVTRIDENGDVLFEGVNVYIQDGGGDTCQEPPYSGKGNLIVGYDEDRIERKCNGGDYNGMLCSMDSYCTGGSCEATVLSEKTGSHNLVVGSRHTYTSCGGIVGGTDNTVSAESAFCAGAGNTASGIASSVVGGVRNTAAGTTSVVVGGNDNTATGPGEITP